MTLRHPAMMQSRVLKPRRAARGLDANHDFRVIAETVPHLVWTAGADGAIDFANRRVFEYFGRRAAKLEGEGWKQLVHPQDWPYCRSRWAQALESGEPYEIQFRLRRADGEYRWHLGAARALRSPSGRILKWVGTCTDIEDQMRAAQVIARRCDALERKVEQAGQALQDKEARLRSIMTLSSDFYWETDADHRFTVIEPGGRFRPIMFVATRLGKTRWETPSVLPDADGWRAHREALAARQAFREFETARKGDDGMVRHYSIDGEPVFDEQGTFRGYRGTGREITDRKRAEQALQASEARLREIIANEPECVKLLDPDGRLLEMNAAGLRMIEAEDLGMVQGKCIYGLIDERHRAAFRALTARVCRGGRGSLEFEMVGLKGTRRWMQTHAGPFRDEAMGKTLLLAITRDITEQKRAEGALRENERRMREFLDSMPAVAWIKDSRFRYSWFSESFARSYGISLDEALGRQDADFWPGDLARHFRSEDEKALSVNGPVQSVDSVPYADGTMSRRLVVKFPLPDESGQLGVAGIAFDITGRTSVDPGSADAALSNPLQRLSARERQVLHLIVDGLTSAEVAARLNLSPKSIDTYRSRLMSKLGIEDLPSLVKFAIRNGLTTER